MESRHANAPVIRKASSIRSAAWIRVLRSKKLI